MLANACIIVKVFDVQSSDHLSVLQLSVIVYKPSLALYLAWFSLAKQAPAQVQA